MDKQQEIPGNRREVKPSEEISVSRRETEALLSLLPDPGDEKTGWKAYTRFIDARRREAKGRLFRVVLSRAAVAAILIGCTWMLAGYWNNHRLPYRETGPQNTITAPPGQRTLITLSDGSKVWLNSQSTLTYPSVFNSRERVVQLEGEAYLEVARDVKKPFIVETARMTVNVYGTSFNISDYPANPCSSVGLVEGSVNVSPRGKQEVWTLQPGEQFNYTGGKGSLAKIDENHYLWRNGIYYFDRMPLSEVMAALSVYYQVKIDILTPRLGERLYTGKFRQQDGITEILRILRMTYHFEIGHEEFSLEYTLR